MRGKEHALAFVSGALFAVGLVLGGMTRPTKVVGFLDVFGDWDPSLAFVMGGAVLVHAIAYRLVARRQGPWLGGGWVLPRRSDIDGRLVGGAVLFGMGWGLAGYCPGPALVSIPSLSRDILIFAPSMVAGMLAYRWVDGWWTTRAVPGVGSGGDLGRAR